MCFLSSSYPRHSTVTNILIFSFLPNFEAKKYVLKHLFLSLVLSRFKALKTPGGILISPGG